MNREPKILIFGAGAIGGSAAAWLAKSYPNVWFIARGEHARAMRERGLTTFRIGKPEKRETVPAHVLGSLSEARDADIVIIAVKNFSLEEAAREVRQALGDRPVVVGMQNGLANQTILPKYFSKVVYCVVGYNAWIERPGEIGYQEKGPLIFGTPDNSMLEEASFLRDLFNPAVQAGVSTRFQDTAHTKLVLNLANSFTTLVGFRFYDIPASQMGLVGKLFTRQLLEGARVVKAAGYHEVKLVGGFSWGLLSVLSALPEFALRGLFTAASGRFFASSMAQDVIQRKSGASELEYLNGYLLELARKTGVPAPINQTVYEMCKEAFAQSEFRPVEAGEIWKRIHGK